MGCDANSKLTHSTDLHPRPAEMEGDSESAVYGDHSTIITNVTAQVPVIIHTFDQIVL